MSKDNLWDDIYYYYPPLPSSTKSPYIYIFCNYDIYTFVLDGIYEGVIFHTLEIMILCIVFFFPS